MLVALKANDAYIHVYTIISNKNEKKKNYNKNKKKNRKFFWLFSDLSK